MGVSSPATRQAPQARRVRRPRAGPWPMTAQLPSPTPRLWATPSWRPGSPALRAGTAVAGVQTDQRGAARDANLPDLGAVEVQHPLSPVDVPDLATDLYGPHPNVSATEAFVKGLYQATLLRPGSAD